MRESLCGDNVSEGDSILDYPPKTLCVRYGRKMTRGGLSEDGGTSIFLSPVKLFLSCCRRNISYIIRKITESLNQFLVHSPLVRAPTSLAKVLQVITRPHSL